MERRFECSIHSHAKAAYNVMTWLDARAFASDAREVGDTPADSPACRYRRTSTHSLRPLPQGALFFMLAGSTDH